MLRAAHRMFRDRARTADIVYFMQAKTLGHPTVVILLWSTVFVLAVVGLAVFFACPDAGAALVVVALILAAPASSAATRMEQRISDVEDDR